MGIKPLNDRVVLKALEKKNTTTSGIYIPEEKNKERPFIYEVIEVGPGRKENEMTVNIGDKVLCGQYAGDEIKYDNNEFKIVAMEYILAIVD